MIKSIPMYGLLYFLLGCDGVVLVWVLAPKRTVRPVGGGGRLYLSGDVWGVLEVIQFPQHLCREFPTMTNVFRQTCTSSVVGFLVFVHCCLVADLPLLGTSTLTRPCNFGRRDPCRLATCFVCLLVQRRPRPARRKTLVSRILAFLVSRVA